LPAFAQFDRALQANFRKDISFILSPANSPSHTQILGITKMEEASLLVPTELGRGGFESLLEHDFKAQLPLCILWYPLHPTSYEDGGRMMQMPLFSKFLCYLEAAARMELAGISCLHQIPSSNGYLRGEGALDEYPGSLGGILFLFLPHPLVIVEAKAIRSCSIS
jgi:hypothetical protein